MLIVIKEKDGTVRTIDSAEVPVLYLFAPNERENVWRQHEDWMKNGGDNNLFGFCFDPSVRKDVAGPFKEAALQREMVDAFAQHPKAHAYIKMRRAMELGMGQSKVVDVPGGG